MINALYEINKVYNRRSKRAGDRMDPSLVEVATESHRLMGKDDVDDCGFHAIKQAMTDLPVPHIGSHITLYPHQASSNEHPNKYARRALDKLSKALQTPIDASVLHGLQQVATDIETTCGSTLSRNEEGFTCLWWFKTVKTSDICRLAILVWIRVITECDLTVLICTGGHLGWLDRWWVVTRSLLLTNLTYEAARARRESRAAAGVTICRIMCSKAATWCNAGVMSTIQERNWPFPPALASNSGALSWISSR